MGIVEHNRSEAALKQMAGPASTCVDEVGIAAMGFAHGATEVAGSRRRENEMHMVGHQAVGPNRYLRLRGLLGQQIQIDFLVAVLKEDRLAPVAALRDMMRKSRNHDPRETCHEARIAGK